MSLMIFIFILDPYASHYQQQLCSSHCSMHSYNNQAIPPPPPPLAPQQNPYYHYAQPCTLHSQNAYATPLMPPPPVSSANSCFQQQHLPHSKSLDQYDAANKMHSNGVNNHRLSLDSHNYKSTSPHNLSPSSSSQMQHMQVNQSFDFIDAAYHHPYNQPNVRAPLPFNLSSNLGSHFSSSHENSTANAGYYTSANDQHNHHQQQQMRNENYYQQPQPIMQLPTPVSDFCQQHSPSHIDMKQPQPELKLRSSLKKSTHSTSDSFDMEHELNELRALKREKSSTPASTSSEMKTRDGIGNYQAWDYVFQNLEKDMEKKKTADEKIAAELESLKITANGHGPPKDRDRHSKSNNNVKASTSHVSSSHSHNNVSSQTKLRTKSVSVSTSTDMPPLLLQSTHEHKRTSSVTNESNHKIQMKKPPELVVGENEWSCRFCTFLNANSKKICEMCSKSKDFFSDAGKSSAATCV